MLHRTLRCALILAVLALLVAAPLVSQAQTDAEKACRTAIAKATGKYVKTLFKLTNKCHKKRSAGSANPATDCNDVEQADGGGKLTKQRAKLTKAIADTSSVCAAAASLLPQYSRCPSPAHGVDDTGATTGIDDFDELAACMIGLSDALVGQASLKAMGNPTPPLSSGLRKCQKDLGKGLTKLVQTIMKERTRCQSGLDSQGQGLDYGCVDQDPKLKIGKSLTKLDAGIAKGCSFSDPLPSSPGNETLDQLGACGDTVAQLQNCVGDITGLRLGSGLIAMNYELPDTCRAGGVRRSINALGGVQLGVTFLDAGWSGLTHGVDVPDFSNDAIVLGCDDDCTNCSVDNDPLLGDPKSYCRCANNPNNSCDVVNGPDTDPAPNGCGPTGNNTCRCFFGPPLSISSGGTPVCVVNQIREDYDGTIDLGAGVWGDKIKLASVVYLGIDSLQPCPICDGDVTPNDAVRDGTCVGGLLAGSGDCDTNAIHPTFGPSSHDCPPNPLTNISGSGLLISLESSNEDQSLAANLPCDDVGLMCPCRVCTGDSTLGCSSDQVCADAGAGTCTGGGGAGVHQNACTDGVCSPQQECNAGPIDRFCSGAATPTGDGYVPCQSNATCSLDGLGTCTIEKRRRCYVHPITVSGEKGVYRATSGALFCIPPTTSGAVNSTGGLPGPGRLSLEFEAEPRCASNPSEIWEAPGGANCAPVTTTTTTTLFPPLPCATSVGPACGGTCPVGEACEPVPPANLTCQCNPVTTTTLPVTPCGDLYPACALAQDDACPMGETCQIAPDLLSCVCLAGTDCADTLFPVCGGTCPLGESCQGDVLGLACVCAPTP